MAEYGIILQIKDIEGNIQLEKFKKGIPAETCSFTSHASRMGYGKNDKRISCNADNVVLQIAYGPWVGLLQHALFTAQDLKEVKITQVAQAIDAKATAEPSVVQTLTLTNPIVSDLSQSWDESSGPRTALISFNFEKILFEIGAKKADFTNKNFTSGAV